MKEYYQRYQRQLILEGFGAAGQVKLSKARVLVIGAGGLGCPVLQYLAAAGVGHLGIADDDRVDISNLNRQVLYGQEDVGKHKTDVAAERVKALNHLVEVVTYRERWSALLSVRYFGDYDVIVDATDNFASRYVINDGCALMKKPLVFGAVSQFEGQVAVFNVEHDGMALSYRDVFPVPPKDSEVMNCMAGGVLGVLPGIIGVMQATEVIKLITGTGEPLVNTLLTYNARSQSIYRMQLAVHPGARTEMPESLEAYQNTDYDTLCR
jgi:molybdopterin/thiamine biosynthesis adenylyltransferase